MPKNGARRGSVASARLAPQSMAAEVPGASVRVSIPVPSSATAAIPARLASAPSRARRHLGVNLEAHHLRRRRVLEVEGNSETPSETPIVATEPWASSSFAVGRVSSSTRWRPPVRLDELHGEALTLVSRRRRTRSRRSRTRSPSPPPRASPVPPLCPCLPSPPFPFDTGRGFSFSLILRPGVCARRLGRSPPPQPPPPPPRRVPPSYPRCDSNVSHGQASSTGAAAASSGDDPPCTLFCVREVCADAFAPSADPAVFAATASDDMEVSAAIPEPECRPGGASRGPSPETYAGA